MSHSMHVDLLDRSFRSGGPTVRQIIAADRPAAIVTADTLAAAAADLGQPSPADAPQLRPDPWSDARSAREGSR